MLAGHLVVDAFRERYWWPRNAVVDLDQVLPPVKSTTSGIVDIVVAIFLILAAAGLMIVVWLPSFSFEFLGLVAAIQRRTGVDPTTSYSMIEFATRLPQLAPWQPGGWFLAVVFVALLIVVPFFHLVVAFLLWELSVTQRVRRKLFVALE